MFMLTFFIVSPAAFAEGQEPHGPRQAASLMAPGHLVTRQLFQEKTGVKTKQQGKVWKKFEFSENAK